MAISVTVSKLMETPAMRGSFLVAGCAGISRVIRRIDVLDLPYPQVEKYLESAEMMMTSFWNSKDSRDSRIGLVNSMIEKGCSALAIMPEICLKGKIDSEIIDIADKNCFPVISLPTTVRYSDIIAQFGQLADRGYEEESYNYFSTVNSILLARDRLIRTRNIQAFLDDLANILDLSLVLEHGAVFRYSGDKNVTGAAGYFMNTIKNIPEGTNHFHLPVPGYFIEIINDRKYKLGIIIHEFQMGKVGLVSNIKKIILESLNTVMPVMNQQQFNIQFSDSILLDDEMYLCAIKTRTYINTVLDICNKNNIRVLDMIPENKCLLVGISDVSENPDMGDVYRRYNTIINQLNPELLVFSDQPCCANFESRLELMNSLLREMGWLKGVFCISELPLIYMLSLATYRAKTLCFNLLQDIVALERLDESCISTLRLYLILSSTKKVGKLQGIHYNTVKYRIQKVLKEYQIVDESNFLNSIPVIPCLLGLELLQVEPEMLSYNN